MSRRGKNRPHTGISLFAFLDVLICTMGALIILLMVLMRQASAEAENIIDQQVATSPAVDEQQLKEQIEDARWRQQLLEQQRLEKAQELSNQRLELSHLEDHIRRLQDRWKDLEAQAQQLQNQDSTKQESREKVAAELAAVAAEIEKSKRDLEIARQRAASKPRSFSIIPYDGPNGTSRRPIYIECTGEAVTIQPEGVSLDARDFEGPLGPGNPLDACLRAVREYLARNPQSTLGGEPYPLLIVKPDGVVGYAAARAAMKSWEDEFGYELIDADTKLAYPNPDPTLKMILERAIVDARRRQEVLAASAPSRYSGTATGQGMRASPHGGFQDLMPNDGYDEEGTASGGGGTGNGIGGNRRSFGNRGDGIGRGGGSAFNEGYAGGNTGRNGANSGDGLGEGDGTGARPQGSGASSRNFGGGKEGGPGGTGGGDANGREAMGGKSGPLGRNGGNGNQPGGSQNGTAGGQRGGQQNGTAGGQSGQRGGQQVGDPNGQAGGQAGGQSGGQAGGQPGGQPGGSPGGDQASGSSAPPNPNAKPIANKRGANWGLPNYQPKATGITRPIRIRVEPGELMLIPERGEKRGPRIVPVDGSMVGATEELVGAIWDEVDSWGIAGGNCYWKPTLSVETAPGAEARVQELEALLDGSGLDVRRKIK